MRHSVVCVLTVCLTWLAACDREGLPGKGDKLGVVVSILPQAFLVERLGGEHVAITVLVGQGRSPHDYEPTPRQIASLAEARVLLTIGVSFEQRLLPKLRAGHDHLRVVDTRAGIPLRRMASGHDNHDHGDGHAHGDTDPHVWLSPRNAKILATNTATALKELDPAHAAEYDANLVSLHAELDALDARIAEALAPLKGQTLLVYHPAFGYFADAYGLRQEPVEVEGKEPTAKQLARLIDEAKRDGVRIIFVQKQFSIQSAFALAKAIDGAVVPLDPLAYDYVSNLQSLADQVAQALRKER